jgi:hypothetical protein
MGIRNHASNVSPKKLVLERCMKLKKHPIISTKDPRLLF